MPAQTQPRLWSLALAGILTETNKAHHDELGGWGLNEHTRSWCTNVLRDSYGITDKAAFDEMLRWLETEGHTAEARKTLAALGPNPLQDEPKQTIARSARAQIEQVGLLAWDAGRLVAVTGWGHWAGFIDEEHAWKTILSTGLRVSRAYDSWRAYGEAYMLGRMYWSGGRAHPGSLAAFQRLLSDPTSPWSRIPWRIDFGFASTTPSVGGGAAPKAKTRFKRSVCPSCGGHKARPSATAYVYCDFCGALADYDFPKACERPAERPGPVYEGLLAQIGPMLEHARARGDVPMYRQFQLRIFDTFVNATPKSCPPRVADARYRQGYVAYMAEGAVVAAFDPLARQHEAHVGQTVQNLHFASSRAGAIKVASLSFRALADAVFAQQEYLAHLYESRGVYALHPDRAPAALQKRIGISLFVQGWLPMLEESTSAELLERAGLKNEYVELDPPKGERADCGGCGGRLDVLPGAKRVVCDACGVALEVGGERLTCRGCGAPLAPAEGSTTVTCPHCKQSLQRVQMMRV